MSTIKQTLFTGWHAMRWVQLVFGIFFLAQAVLLFDGLSALIGGVFLFMALANKGCCGACAAPVQSNAGERNKDEEYEDINFEEIKDK